MPTVAEQVATEFACTHADAEWRRRTIAGGATVINRQCSRCGQYLAALKKTALLPMTPDMLPPYDEELAGRWQKQRSDRFAALRAAEQERDDGDWWARYQDYLASPAWRSKRLAVLSRDGYLCQGCRSAQAVEVHHLTYEHLGDELLFELISLCTACHARVDNKPEAPASEQARLLSAAKALAAQRARTGHEKVGA